MKSSSQIHHIVSGVNYEIQVRSFTFQHLRYIREAVKTLIPARDPLLGGMKFTTTTVFCEAAG